MNYFDVLELSVNDIQGKDEAAINRIVNTAHKKLYALTVGAYATVPRPDGKTQTQWQNILNDAKTILLDPQKRRDHIAQLNPTLEPQPHQQNQQSNRPIIKFRNGDEATSIPQLATLMEKNAKEAADMLYRGRLEQALAGVGEVPLADAAEEIVKEFSSDRSIGLMAMVAVLHKTVKMSRGTEAKTQQQLALLIDQNWEQSKTLLYNGFIALWFKYTNPGRLTNTIQRIINTYRNDHDIGLEELVQRLDPEYRTP